jgi:hypothetical protein
VTATDEDREPIRLGAGAGLVANGVLHLLVAWLAARLVFGRTDRADQGGALQGLAAEPFGGALLWLVAASFAAVVLWRAREAVWGVPLRPRAPRPAAAPLVRREPGRRVRGAHHAGGPGGGGAPGRGGGQGVAAHLLRLLAGRVLVVAIGVGVVVVGVVMAYRSWVPGLDRGH